MDSCSSDDALFVFHYFLICLNSFYESKYGKGLNQFYTVSKGSCGGVRRSETIPFPKKIFRASGYLAA